MPGPWRNWVDNVSSQLAFYPPRPPTYQVQEHDDGTGELYLQPLIQGMPRLPQCHVMRLRTAPTAHGGFGGGEEIVTVHIRYKPPAGAARHSTAPSADPHRLTLLYSHGNAVDLGQMLPVFRELSKLLKVNIMAYDYSGYGASSGEPSISKTFADVTAVYESLVDNYDTPPSRIVLYGQSVGTGPAAWLASHRHGLAGVVLHSPLLSGMRVLSPSLKWWPSFADVYPNHRFVRAIQCPTLVMHGTEDEVIHISCGQKLASLVKEKWRYPPLWAEGFGHQNVEQCPRFVSHLQGFLAHALVREPEEANGQAS